LWIAAEPNVPHVEVDPVDAVEDQEEQGREHQEESDKKKTFYLQESNRKNKVMAVAQTFGE
jgi:hypothetical protein